MSAVNAAALLAAAGGEYQISRSVRLRSSASAYFNRTPTSSGNSQKFTWSGWVKRGTLSSGYPVLFMSGNTINDYTLCLNFDTSDKLTIRSYGGNWITSNGVYRDPSAWYHIIVSVDTTQAVSTDRVKLYVNGSQISGTYGTAIPQNFSFLMNTAVAHTIGHQSTTWGFNYFDGYMTEINFVDGQALTPSSFGETDAVTGVWKPKKYAGTYGTNGFYLNFSDPSAATAAAIGKDYSGNGNNWTPNNISVTVGVTYDSMLDVPTMWADGGNGRGNYPVINPLDYVTTNGSISNGNLTYTTNTSGSNNYQRASMKFPTSGKWYAEFTATQVNIGSALGYALIGVEGSNSFLWWVYSSPFYQIQGTNSTYTTIPTISSGDVIMVAVDMDSGKAWYGQNGTWLLSGNPANGTAMSNPATFTAGSSNIGIAFDGRTGSAANIINANFGQRPFAYTPPTGFKALNTQNLPDATIKKGNQYFDATTYTGTGSAQSIVNSGAMQPDFTWVKSRSNAAYTHILQDSVRGVGNFLISASTSAEAANSQMVTSYNSNGFTVNVNGNVNANAETYVGWQWKESASAGFDIVTFSPNGSGITTVNHSLGVAPSMIITKTRAAVGSWTTYHAALGNTQYIYLNLTNAAASGSTVWNNTSPTSTQFTLGSAFAGAGTTVAYLFAEVAGFSKFGSYTGNGSADGPFVYCGFRPAFVMVKRTDTTANWILFDRSRLGYNTNNDYLLPNSSSSEGTDVDIDLLSNGFKARDAASPTNASSGTYIFAAFAENPFKNSLAR